MEPQRNNLLHIASFAILFTSAIISSCSEFEPLPPEGESSWVKSTDILVRKDPAVTDITTTGAKVKYIITSTGGRKIYRTVFIYSATEQFPDTLDNPIELGATNVPVEYLVPLKDLTHNTKYYFRLYIRGMDQKGYFPVYNFTTIKDKKYAEVTSGSASLITLNTATLEGNIISTGEGNTTVIQHGHVWATQNNPTINDNKTQLGVKGTGSFSSSLTTLQKSTKYYYRAYATNSYATVYGETKTFNTNGIPVVNTGEIDATSAISVKCGGEVTNTGGYPVTARGVCWSTSTNPTISNSKTTDGIGAGVFTSTISNLAVGTTYYVRAYATNSEGTAYGEQKTFVAGTVKDIEGNSYTTINIGNQVWIKQDLRTKKYNNGDLIGTTSNDIREESSPKYQWAAGGDESNVLTYGRLYTWYVVNDDRGICPVGWRVPNNNDWTTLTDFLGGQQVAGGKLKEAGEAHWGSPNIGATNASGFTAVPSGGRLESGGNNGFGTNSYYWSITEKSVSDAYIRFLRQKYFDIGSSASPKLPGYSVRCVRNY